MCAPAGPRGGGRAVHPDLAWAHGFPTRRSSPSRAWWPSTTKKVDLFLSGQRLEPPKTHFFASADSPDTPRVRRRHYAATQAAVVGVYRWSRRSQRRSPHFAMPLNRRHQARPGSPAWCRVSPRSAGPCSTSTPMPWMRRRAAGPGIWQAADDRGGRQDTGRIGAADGRAGPRVRRGPGPGRCRGENDPAQESEWRDLLAALRRTVEEELIPRQRDVFEAIVVNEVPADALVAQLGSNRNAIYKMMFDARHKLRAALAANGYLSPETSRRS